ncbi:MAG: DUF1294 domain-containing protein [Comamonadaceae bacterium]|nr:MAG: DUF1294 domain-containing protein [Comamonadaceae bacterium]
MRFEGTLTTWNDERGFGFLRSPQGGDDIFVHAKAFGGRGGRPQVGQAFSFEIEPGPQGRKRAKNVLPARAVRPRRSQASRGPAPWGTASLFAIPLFLVTYAVVTLLWKPPLAIAAVYLVASLVAFVAYAIDKSAATRGEWRTQESTLHLLALAGGWPGALLAQQLFRHKSAKAEFRTVFWATVIFNVAAFVLLCSPMGRRYWPSSL